MLDPTVGTYRSTGTRIIEMQAFFCYIIKATIYSVGKQKKDQRKKNNGKEEKL